MPIKPYRSTPAVPEESAMDWAFKPLVGTGATDAMAESISTPRLDEDPSTAKWKGFLAGATQGVGNVVSGFTSPVALASLLSGLGPLERAAAGVKGAATALKGVQTGANALFALHGAKQALDPHTNVGQKLMGVVEGAGGAAGTLAGIHGLMNPPVKTVTPKPVLTPATEPPFEVSTDLGQRTFHSPVPQRGLQRPPKPSPEETFLFQEDINRGLNQGLKGAPTGEEMLGGVDEAITDAAKQGKQARTVNERDFNRGTKAEQSADAQWYKTQQQNEAEQLAANEIDRIRTEGGLKKKPTVVKNTVKAPSEFGTQTATESWSTKKGKTSETGGGGGNVPGQRTYTRQVPVEGGPPPAGPAKDIYDAWIASGSSPEDALTRAAGGVRYPSQATITPTEEPSINATSSKADKLADSASGVSLLDELLSATHPGEEVPKLNPLGHGTMPAEPPAENVPGFESTSKNAFTRSQQENSYQELLNKLRGEAAPPAAVAEAVSAASKPAPARYQGHPEVEAMFDQLGEAYRGGDKTKGKELAELRDFMGGGKMRESWKGAPSPTPEAAAIEQQMVALPEAQPIAEPTVPEPPTEPEYNTSGDWVNEELGKVNRMKGEAGAVDPMLLTRLGLGGVGAAYGATQGDTPEERTYKAMLLGGAGFLAPSVPGFVKGIATSPNIPEAISDAVSKGVKIAPNIQRANYLTDAWGLAANAGVGPYGSAVLGALKHTLASPWTGDTRGIEALKGLSPAKFAKSAWNSWSEASRRLQAGELGRYEGQLLGEKPGLFQRGLQYPGTILTTGDVGAQERLAAGGFTEPETRSMTMTNEPELFSQKKIAGLGKGEPDNPNDISKTLLEMMFPFKRTPANIGEQAAFNMPGLGFYFNKMRKNPDSIPLQVAGQTINAGVGGLSYYLGLQMDPSDPNTRIVRKFLTNGAGPHGAMAAAMFAVGQAHHAGKPATAAGVTAGLRQGLPLPTIEPMQDWAKFMSGGFQMKDLPNGALPPEMRKALIPEKVPSLRTLHKLRR